MTPKSLGELSEGLILAYLLRLGWVVSIPFGNNQRYDMVVERNGELLKAQCKTGRIVNGCVQFATCSRNGVTQTRRAYHGEADIFLVYCHQNNAVYCVPVQETGKTNFNMRIEPTKGGTKSHIKWAKDYQI